MQRKQVVLIIGGNLYNRRSLLDQCRKSLSGVLGTEAKASSIYESEAWGGKSSGDYLNQVLVYDTTMDAMEILYRTQALEMSMGRTRTEKWGDRSIDIDILSCGEDQFDTPQLVIPHPFLHLRRFVLVPLAEVLPNWKHPFLHKTSRELLELCSDPTKVWECV